MSTAKDAGKDRITIPRQTRKPMALEAGDCLAFELDEVGGVRVNRVRNESHPLRGLLSKYGKSEPVDDAQVRTALGRRAKAKYTVR